MSVEEEQGGNIAKDNSWTSSNMITLAALLRLLEWKDTYIRFLWDRKKRDCLNQALRSVQSYLEIDIHIYVMD